MPIFNMPDLIELQSLTQFETYSVQNGGILGVVDTATRDGSSATNVDNSDDLYIDGVRYNILPAVSDNDTVTVTTFQGGATNYTGDQTDFSQAGFIVAEPVGGGAVRYFMVIDDNFGDIGAITSIQTRSIDYDPAGNDFQINSTQDNSVARAVCFAADTLIDTPTGRRRIQDLRVGDAVVTLDHGVQTIRYRARQEVPAAAIRANPNLRPIRLRAGSLGPGVPERDLVVSPQHRILLRSAIAERMFGSREVLIAAVKLTAMPGIGRCDAGGDVAYHHIMFDRHEIVLANGAPAESLLRGRHALGAMSTGALTALAQLLGTPRIEVAHDAAARPVQGAARRIARMLERHRRNARALVDAPA